MSYIISRPWGGACGVGHQFHNWLAGWLLAKRYNLTFVHSPLCGRHIQNQIDSPVELWERFLGLGIGEVRAEDIDINTQVVQLPKIIWDECDWETCSVDHPSIKTLINHYDKDEVVFECARDQFFVTDWSLLNSNVLRNKFEQALSMIRSDRQEGKKDLYGNIDTTKKDNKIHVAIHIRRGDVTENGRYKVRWVPTDVYMNIMNQIAFLYGSENVHFHIFSDETNGLKFMMMTLMGCKVDMQLWGSNVFESFVQMVNADILVTGQSMFSVLAGHLCDNVVLARPWSPHWNNFPDNGKFIEVQSNGDFETQKLKGLKCTS